METLLSNLTYAVPAFLIVLILLWLMSLRRIVPTNVVHIVQRGSKTVSYGVGKGSNVYYEFPKWIPVIGVEVRILPVSNFDIDLANYSAYDKDRVPFLVDVKAFFHIADTNKAAEKVESFHELKQQLTNVVQGAVRSILAKSKLEEIMEERSVFGEKFTQNVQEDLKNWGVEPIKNIELMDIRDSSESNVIHQIMAKRMSAIDKESRMEVASNRREAEQAELNAKKEVEVTRANTEKEAGTARARSERDVNVAKADADKISGVAAQQAAAEIAEQERATAEKNMEVIRVRQLRQAEIDKDSAVVLAEQERRKIEIATEADKFRIVTEASADLEAAERKADANRKVGTAEADVIKAQGLSQAEARKAMELSTVAAQTALAKEIGTNEGYQAYLIKTREIEANQEVGITQYKSIAEALSNAELKMLVNSGDVNSGLNKLSDIFTSKGGSQLNGLLESLGQTEVGSQLLETIKTALTKKES